MSHSNSNIIKFNKNIRFSFDEASDRTSKGKKLNKTKKTSNKRDIWNDEQD